MSIQKPYTWISRHQLIRNKLLLGITGDPITSRPLVQKYIQKLRSYCERKNSKNQITHFVTVEDVEKWNKQVIDKLKKSQSINQYGRSKSQ